MGNFLLAMLQSLGTIFGPLMILAGLVAVVACVRASVRTERRAARRSLACALVPPALGVVGALFGLTVWAASGRGAGSPDWTALGYTVLFGVFVAAGPALWSLVLLSRRPAAFA